jgi:hypothetical protein
MNKLSTDAVFINNVNWNSISDFVEKINGIFLRVALRCGVGIVNMASFLLLNISTFISLYCGIE